MRSLPAGFRARVRRRLLSWYARNGRSHLPWRRTTDPYAILISEIMLQQTQVDRVTPKYETFLARFPDFQAIAGATTADLLRAWEGLGYNSRAVRLKRLARTVVEGHDGELPRDRSELLHLAGIGPYTASAVRAFAFNLNDAPIDTNVRRVVDRLLTPAMKRAIGVDRAARELVPPRRSHDWNSALMDLGAAVCLSRNPRCARCSLRPVCASAGKLHRRDAKPLPSTGRFEDTDRYARGRIVERLRRLPSGQRIRLLDLHGELQPLLKRSPQEFDTLVARLAGDGLLERHGEEVALSGER